MVEAFLVPKSDDTLLGKSDPFYVAIASVKGRDLFFERLVASRAMLAFQGGLGLFSTHAGMAKAPRSRGRSRRKSISGLPRPLDLIGMEVNRSRRHGSMPQVVPHGRQFYPARERVVGMGVPHSVRRGRPELVRRGRAHAFQGLHGVEEEAAHDRSQARRTDAGAVFCQAGNSAVLGFQRDRVTGRPRCARY